MAAVTVVAATSWPDAAIAIAGVALVGAVLVVILWQGLAIWRARILASHEDAYRTLAEQTARDVRTLNERLGDGAGRGEGTMS